MRRHAIDTYFDLVASSRHTATILELYLVNRFYDDALHLRGYEGAMRVVITAATPEEVRAVRHKTYLNQCLSDVLNERHS